MKKLSTGEPYAGEPHVRFGGRGSVSFPYPYSHKDVDHWRWLPSRALDSGILPE
jgi:hypothetical protein